MKNRAGQEKKELLFNLIATGVVVGLAIVCPTAGVAAGAIYTAIDVGGAIKGEDLISGRKLSDEERLTRGAFAIVPGAGGLAAKSLLKHMPALKTVMKTVSKPVNDAVNPIKSTVDSIGLKGNQSIETVITKKQKQVSPVISNLKPGKQSIASGIKTTKHHDTLDIPTKFKFATKLEQAKELGKAYVEQLKFVVTHPIIATVISKAGQKSIRGSAKYIDNALRPVEVRTVQTTTGNKVFAGFERGESTGKLTGKADNYIAIKQVEKDAIRGTMGTGGKAVDDVIKDESHFLDEFTLKPNIKYETNGYSYQTDDLGRIKKASGELTLDIGVRDNKHQLAAGGEDRVKAPSTKGDHGGHLIGTQFNGSPLIDNIVAMNGNVNVSAYKKLENAWAGALREGQKVFVDIQPMYIGESIRPSTFKIKYKIGDIKYQTILENVYGGK